MNSFWKFIFHRIMKWSITGDVPRNLNKYMIIVAPHTSNWDFIIGLFVRRILKFRSSYLAKSQLFSGPFGFLFRSLGGFPVYRDANHNLVDQVVKLAQANYHFVIAITPEGTRKEVTKWKTGFYYIALKSGLPVVMASLDYENRNVKFSAPYHISGNQKVDTKVINQFFEGVKGKRRAVAPFILE